MSLYLSIAIIALISAIVSSAIGFIWYGPLFGKLYASIMGMDMSDQAKMEQAKKAMPFLMGINFALAFLLYYAFAFSAALLINPNGMKGIVLFALFIWLGFMVPVSGTIVLWSGKSPKATSQLFLMTIGYQLIAALAAALIWVKAYPYFM